MRFQLCLLLLLTIVFASCTDKPLFEQIASTHSGVLFNNKIPDDDSINVLEIENVYNGGGVGVADFNHDGLQDLYFTGNLVSNKLYLNHGDFRFEDITAAAGVDGMGRWSRGVSLIDINNDGWMDIYLSTTILLDHEKRKNILYVNQGLDASGVPHFKDMAAEYGLADTTHSTMAAFFDYDNDGDLDCYLLVNQLIKGQYPNAFRHPYRNGEHASTGKLYRNDWNDSLGHPVYTNVSREAGILVEGFGHGVSICDLNQDGWKDIYVTNDFIGNNILYINNGNGTFTDKAASYFKHTAENAMGQDIVDINNDGLDDVIELDMNPEDNYRKKMMMNQLDYDRYRNNLTYGYQFQYVRNTLNINQGMVRDEIDSSWRPAFSDVAYMAGIAETDWSWTPLVADFDNDGWRDIIITNGFPRDVTDHDFIAYRNEVNMYVSKRDLLEKIPAVQIPNYAYRNRGDLEFENVTDRWGLNQPSFSNGAAYADLDNDGDLDIVINNINHEAFIYRNRNREQKSGGRNAYVEIRLEGTPTNKNGLGAKIDIHYGGKKQSWDQTPYRGYLSTIPLPVHFGLGDAKQIDSILVHWPDGRSQSILHAGVDTSIVISWKNALPASVPVKAADAVSTTVPAASYFSDVTKAIGIEYLHRDSDVVDFNVQKLLPHKLSEQGPALAVGDLDGNGTHDLIVGGSFYYPDEIFLQRPDGSFYPGRPLLGNGDTAKKRSEHLGICLFDADSDGDLDCYITSGGYEARPGSPSYADEFYLNDGKANFSLQKNIFPENNTSKSCVRAADFDHDGDLDLFVAGRVEPGNYPKPVSSFIYRNDSKDGRIRFVDVSNSIAPGLHDFGMVTDMMWTDYDQDGWEDILLCGEWMPITFLKNNKGKFDTKDILTLPGSSGWWNSLTASDFDGDGDIDYVAGNLGKNSYYQGSEKYPLRIYYQDFDHNGTQDCITTKYLKDRDGRLAEFPVHLRDAMVDQIPLLKKKYPDYGSFARTRFQDMFSADEMSKFGRLEAVYFSSALIENRGDKGFALHPLPAAAQVAPLKGMIAEDFNGDGIIDLALNGNDFGTEVMTGRYDAMNGLLLLGNGKGGFEAQTLERSGLYLPGDGRALVKLVVRNKAIGNGSPAYVLVAGTNKGKLKCFSVNRADSILIPLQGEHRADIIKASGQTENIRVLNETSYLSQSPSFFFAPYHAGKVFFIGDKGDKRLVYQRK